MPRAFVTGATGFVGGHLARSLARRGWAVEALAGRGRAPGVSPGVAFHQHDGTTRGMVRILEAARPDVVFHLASVALAEHKPDELEGLIAANVLLGAQLAEAMACAGVRRMVNTGTYWQHFGGEDYRPVNLYAATKQAFEDILAYYQEARGLAVITLKLFDTFGPGDPRRKLVSILLEAARTGDALSLSPGEQVLDLLHVDDAVAAFVRAAELLLASEAPASATYFVSGTRLTVRSLAERVSQAAGRPIRAVWGGRPYRSREVMVPVHPGEQALPGWTPRIDLDAALVALARDLAGEVGGPSPG